MNGVEASGGTCLDEWQHMDCFDLFGCISFLQVGLGKAGRTEFRIFLHWQTIPTRYH